jgi:OmpA-OmpF porin, OOP family
MASKKLKLLFMGVFILLATGAFAQKGTYDVFDSSKITTKRMAQQNEFRNNTYNFPAKPRNMWELGISGGMLSVNGDVPAEALKSWGASFHVRKAMGYLFSLRLQGTYGVAKGQDWGASTGWGNNSAWTAPLGDVSKGYRPGDFVFYNYRSKIWDVQLQGIFSLNNILFHKAKTSWLMYAGLGGGVTGFHTMVNALDAANNNYAALFNSFTIADMTYANRKSTRDKLKAGMDNTYETEAETQGYSRQKKATSTMKPSVSLIGGFQFKLSKRINIAIEDKLTVVHSDLVDGQRWSEHGGLTPNDDTYNYVSLGINFNIGNKNKSVEPLYWINPLDYVYQEVNVPRHTKFPKPVLDDADNDGVTDQFDQCPNTPSGVKVDTHGCPVDTDGDGVPDFKDKELITPTSCQPVDADGVGKCPPPACCKELSDRMDSSMTKKKNCDLGSLPSITFKGKGVSALSKDQKTMLATVASKMKTNADCSITVTGHPATSKASQSLCNKRVAAIKKYLMEKEGISGDRITTSCEGSESGNDTIDISSAQ